MALPTMPARPAEGLYDPSFEHDACGVAFVAQLSGEASHDIVAKGLTALENLDHRGATGADEFAGDGAGRDIDQRIAAIAVARGADVVGARARIGGDHGLIGDARQEGP